MTNRSGARVAHLGRRALNAATPEAARYVLWDDELSGFGLRVEPSGTMTYLVRYRVGGGRRGTLRQFKIGSATKLTPDEARDLAKKALGRVEAGEDPQAERAADRQVLTVAELCDLYLAEGVATKKASTLALDRIRIAGHIKPLLGTRKITELGAGDVERMMNAIGDGKVKPPPAEEAAGFVVGSRVRGGKTAATKTVKLLKAMFAFAIGRRLCTENPCAGVKTFPDGKRERFLSPAELGRLGEALASALGEGAHPHHVTIIRLLLLTGARKNEIARLRWSEVDFERGLLQLEDSKTGRRPIHLGAPALAMLSGVERTESRFVFPDPRDPGLPIRNLDWAWVGFRKRADLDGLRIHDLRHSFASVGIAGGSGLFLIRKLLGHSHITTTQRYAHLADDPVKAAADKIASAVAAAMVGSGEVSDLKGGRRV